jgi:hypothetical protein
VADVHTDSNTGQVLEEGVGFAKLLVAAYELADGRRFLGAGPVLSYFEFKWPMADRMTDAQWSALLQSTNAPLAPSWTRAFGWPVVLPAEDSDGDQLPDAWEAKHWGNLATMNNAKADSDGDGACNAAELRSGTDPNDPESALRFRSIHRTGAEMRLEWRGAANRPCRVHYSDDLWHWYLLSTPVQGAPDGHATVTDSNATNSACRFYRLQAIPAGVGD